MPTAAIGDKIPLELWKGKVCDIQGEIKRIKVFGCRVWYLISPNRRKFDSRADEGIFVGYDRQVKGYKIYLLKTKKVTISCHIRFEEDVFPYKNANMDMSNIKKRSSEWIWDVEDSEFEGESDFFVNSLVNENNQEVVVNVPIVHFN